MTVKINNNTLFEEIYSRHLNMYFIKYLLRSCGHCLMLHIYRVTSVHFCLCFLPHV